MQTATAWPPGTLLLGRPRTVADPAQPAAVVAARMRLSMPGEALARLPETLATTLTLGGALALLAAPAALPVPVLGTTERQCC